MTDKQTASAMAFWFAFFRTDDSEAAALASSLLPEGRTWDVKKGWSVRVDNSHPPNTEKHYHVLLRGQDVAVINQNGTPSHGSDLDEIPNRIRDWMSDKGLIDEGYLSTMAKPEGVPINVINEAVAHEELQARTVKYISMTPRDTNAT